MTSLFRIRTTNGGQMCRLPLLLYQLCAAVPFLNGFRGEFRFASYYGDHMVLQQAPERSVVWGYGDSESKVIVTVTELQGNELNRPQVAFVQDGIWRVSLDPVKAGGPYNVTAVQQGNFSGRIVLTDVLFGDVWLCGGQSNMAFTVSQLINATDELNQAAKYPHVRIFMAALDKSTEELRDLPGVEVPWAVPTAELLGGPDFTHFSAVCWLFGRYLMDTLHYPVGLVESCWGGTPVEAWSSRRALQRCHLAGGGSRFPDPRNGLSSVWSQWNNSVLWNAMIHPLLNMTIKGAIWYQGEANTQYHQDQYNCSFPAMIDDWRMAFHEGSGGQTAIDFPFGFVQISTWQKDSTSDAFPNLRWHQTADYGYAPNPRMKRTFMAVSLDLPDETSPTTSIHPRYKQDVAFRLTLGARAVAYGEKGVSFQGPFPYKILLLGDIISITYNQPIFVNTSVHGKLFEICCFMEVKRCWSLSEWLSAPIMHWGQGSIELDASACAKTVSAVRYAWRDWPCDLKSCPIYSVDEVLPAPPFVTNRWPQRDWWGGGNFESMLGHRDWL